MKFYQNICCILIALLCVGTITAQTEQTKDEQRYHNKENQKFVNSVASIQDKIHDIKADKSLSEAEKRAQIEPLFEEMLALRKANSSSREWKEKDSKPEKDVAQTKKSRKSNSDVADSGNSRKENKMNARQRKKRIKALQKDIQDTKKNTTLTKAERDMKLQPLMEELIALQSNQIPDTDIAMENSDEKILKAETITAKGKEKDQWRTEQEEERKQKMDTELDRRKVDREKAREKRDTNIEKWKAEAEKEQSKKMAEKKAQSSMSSQPVTTTKSTVKQTTDIPQTDEKIVQKQIVTSVTSTSSSMKRSSSSKQGMLQRLTRMSENLEHLKTSGLITEENYKLKMSHIRAARERFLGV